MATNLEEIFAVHHLDGRYLNQICSKERRDEFTKRIKDWKSVGVALGFTQDELDMIDGEYETDNQKKTTLLIQWSMRERKKATYINLAELLFAGGLLDLLEDLCSVLTKALPTSHAPCSSDVDEPKRGTNVHQRVELKHQREESRYQGAESTNQGTLELYQPKNQVSTTDTSQQLLQKSECQCTSVILNEKNIVHLMRLLQSYSYKWNPIGLSLGFTHHELNTIFGMIKLLVGAPVSYLQELLSQWVQWPTTEHPNHPTLEILCAALQSSLVGLGSLAEKVEKELKQCITGLNLAIQSDNDQDVASKIEQLETQFRNLHKCILDELMANEDMNIQTLLHALTLLPIKLKREYEKAIAEKLPTLPREGSISELFLHLNPLFSFLDYNLLEYIVKIFGSCSLNEEMQSYCCKVRDFMKQTTVQQLIDYWPCNTEDDPNISKVIAKINKDPQSCNLSELDALRRRICICVRLSDIICTLVGATPSQSFIVVWRLPSVLAPQIIDAIKQTEQSFFIKEDITSIFVDDLQLYSFRTIWFGSELKQQYQVIPTSVSHADWIISPTEKIFKLAIIQREQVEHGQIDDKFVQMTISGRIDDILHIKTPIELENILNSGDQQIILIEGAPGSGKSTLAIHICQKWGKGKLFQQYTIVILVQLRDPALQRAQTIADLLPVENVAIAQDLATKLIATNGCGVLWVLDGWDELPPHLQQDSIFRKLLPPKPTEEKLTEIEQDPLYRKYATKKCSKEELWSIYLQNNPVFRTQYYKNKLLDKASVIVTSRPISSGDLHPVVSSRIEVLGFTPEEQRKYFIECLKGDTKTLQALLDKIQENPIIQSSCYLPLNAALTVYYFNIKGYSLPSTEYEVFSTVIIHCVLRHLEREGRDQELPNKFECLSDLSGNKSIREPFLRLCELAYHGVMENKVTFSSSDLPEGSNTLSLLQAVQSFLQSGKSVFYNFYHLSFQELLAGYYIATSLPDCEQISQFQQLFHQPRFISVFQFYAAITKLKTPGIDKIITKITSMRSKRHLLSLLRCLYEAQDPSLCQWVAKQLKILDVCRTSLNPMDLLSIGYFISMSGTSTFKKVRLDYCNLGDQGVKNLMKYIARGKGAKTREFEMIMSGNNIHEDGIASIAEVLQNSGIMSSLNFYFNSIGVRGMQSIAKALINNTSLVELELSQCSAEITEENGPVVAEMLQKNKTLRKLNLINNRGISDVGLCFIAKGLRENVALKFLKMSRISALGGKALATAIATNNSLVELDLAHLEITEDSGPSFVDMLQQNTSLRTLTLSGSISEGGISYIAEGLERNATLKKLDVRKVSMTSSEAKTLSRMLPVNVSLTLLDISGNPIGDDGISHLAVALTKNKGLQTLNAVSCNITDTGLALLADAVRVNNSLADLDLGQNDKLTEKGVTHLVSILSRESKKIVIKLSQHIIEKIQIESPSSGVCIFKSKQSIVLK